MSKKKNKKQKNELKVETKKDKKKAKLKKDKSKKKKSLKKLKNDHVQKVSALQVYSTLQHLATLVTDLNTKPVIFNGFTIYKAEIATLRAIEELQPVKTMTLANSLKVTRNAVLKNANKLLHKGLIEKDRNNENRRVIEFKLSKMGEKFLNEYNPSTELNEQVLQALSHMSETELAYFNDALERILLNLNLSN